jgi:vacuolar iron transporter family protein
MARGIAPRLVEHDHAPEAIRARLAKRLRPSYLRDWVYGGIDGAVTTFAVVSGVQGAELAASSALILGIANLIADGFSMAASNYAGTQTEVQLQKHYEAIERKHIALAPDGEKEEVRQILARKGLRDEGLSDAVRAVTADQERWVRTMLLEEYGLPMSVRSPRRAAFSTFVAFIICGAVPLIPYVFNLESKFQISAGLTGVVFFMIGSLRSKWAVLPWWRTGVGTLMVGSLAASLAYGIGALLGGTHFLR